MPGPISPREAEAMRVKSIPEEVYVAFNELIGKKYVNGEATVLQDDAVALILSKLEQAGRKTERRVVFDSGWLDIEKEYEAAGWRVQYDKPAIGESYAANFRFIKKRKS